MYNEIEYWNKRKDPNAKNLWLRNDAFHISFVEQNISDVKNVLDFGPGVGRIFPAYRKTKSVIGYDITSQHNSVLKSKAYENNINFEMVNRNNVSEKLPFGDEQFDAVVCVSVLLHQRPIHITDVMSELCRVSKKVIVISAYNSSRPFLLPGEEKDRDFHVFNYDYKSICKNKGWEVDFWEVDYERNQTFFVYKKR
tara:strand:+ start:2252 stop:2839 length:588 start_codon:yes stop_codon:yes gene_type:complete